MNEQHYPFDLVPLPYPYDGLEPSIDTLTMHLHHDRHLKTYVDNLNKALKDFPEFQSWSLEKLIRYSNCLPEAIQTPIKRNAGGVYNHEFFFSNLAPASKQGTLSEELNNAISGEFGSFEKFKEEFKKEALSVFGSGYAWLVLTMQKHLKIIQTANQDTPLTLCMNPIFCIDVWEHAYYLKHYNDRGAYIDDWFNVVNLNAASENYAGGTLPLCEV